MQILPQVGLNTNMCSTIIHSHSKFCSGKDNLMIYFWFEMPPHVIFWIFLNISAAVFIVLNSILKVIGTVSFFFGHFGNPQCQTHLHHALYKTHREQENLLHYPSYHSIPFNKRPVFIFFRLGTSAQGMRPFNSSSCILWSISNERIYLKCFGFTVITLYSDILILLSDFFLHLYFVGSVWCFSVVSVPLSSFIFWSDSNLSSQMSPWCQVSYLTVCSTKPCLLCLTLI